MKVTDKFRKGQTLFAFELLPPLKGETISSIYHTVDVLGAYQPAYINITYHREEVKFIEREGGLLERRVVRKRPGTVGISAAIAARYGIDVVPQSQHVVDAQEIHLDQGVFGLVGRKTAADQVRDHIDAVPGGDGR